MQSRDDKTGGCLGFSEACLSELGFAKSNPEGRSSQFLFNSNLSYELAIGSVFDLSPLEAQIKGYMDLQILNCQVLFCEMKTSTGSGVSEADSQDHGATLHLWEFYNHKRCSSEHSTSWCKSSFLQLLWTSRGQNPMEPSGRHPSAGHFLSNSFCFV